MVGFLSMSKIKIEKFEYDDGTSEFKILVNINFVKPSFKNQIYMTDGEWAPVFTKYNEHFGIGVFNVHPYGRYIYHSLGEAQKYVPVIRDRIIVNDKIIKNRTVCYEV